MAKKGIDPSKPFYVKFEVPKELADAVSELLKISKETGKIKKGTNETTKAVERGVAKLVVIAQNVEPPEIVAHLPLLCEERKTPYVYLQDKKTLGEAIGLGVQAASACILDPGDGKGLLGEILSTLGKIVK